MADTFFQSEQLFPFLTRLMLPGGVYGYLAEGSERALLIDTGYGYGDLKSYVESLTDKPYDVVITHGHVDHAPGAGQFEKVYMNLKDLEVFAVHGDLQLRVAHLGGYDGQGGTADPALMVPQCAPEHFTALVPEQTFDLGGLTVKALPIPGHTPGGMGMLLVEPKVLIAGDMLCSMTLVGLPFSLTVSEYHDGLAAFAKKYAGTFDTMLFSHPHNVGGPEILPDMIALCEAVMEGKDAHFAPPAEPGRPAGVLAREMGPDLRPVGGGIANIIYNPDRVFPN